MCHDANASTFQLKQALRQCADVEPEEVMDYVRNFGVNTVMLVSGWRNLGSSHVSTHWNHIMPLLASYNAVGVVNVGGRYVDGCHVRGLDVNGWFERDFRMCLVLCGEELHEIARCIHFSHPIRRSMLKGIVEKHEQKDAIVGIIQSGTYQSLFHHFAQWYCDHFEVRIESGDSRTPYEVVDDMIHESFLRYLVRTCGTKTVQGGR
jgi:hypothetical protein